MDSESIHTPWIFPQFAVLQPEFKIDVVSLDNSNTHTQITHNVKVEMVLDFTFYKWSKNNHLVPHMQLFVKFCN
jgi:hypothetical protein